MHTLFNVKQSLKPLFQQQKKRCKYLLVFPGLIASRCAMASTAGGLPWDSAVTTLTNDLTGPVATGVSVVAFLAAGSTLIFGEDLGGISKKLLYVVLGAAVMVLGNKFLSVLGLTGAMVF